MKIVPAIVGPTASGKTPLSLFLAERLEAEIVSADSRQVYRYLDIGTAKPSVEDRRRIRHHFVDILDPREEYSAGRYGREARETIQKMMKAGAMPVICGGSGLYIKAAVDGLFDGPGNDPEIRARLEEELKLGGVQKLLDDLRAVDPVTAEAMAREPKPRRIMRALEVYAITGRPISHFQREQETKAPFEVALFGLSWERRELYRRIDDRVDMMMKEGLVEEVEGLRREGYEPTLNSLQSVGYKEIFAFLGGTVTRDRAVELIKQNTRRFAKRQLTWFRADPRIRWLSANEQSDLAELAGNIARALNRSRAKKES